MAPPPHSSLDSPEILAALRDLEAFLQPTSELPAPLVVCGPSGAGKGTLIKRLQDAFPDRFGFSVSHTTRKPRPGEVDGKDYHFSDHERMEAMKVQGEFVEDAQVHGNMYGTSKAAVEAVQRQGQICILDIDVQGTQQVKATAPFPGGAKFLFVEPPSLEILEQRLRDRGTEVEEKIQVRLKNAIGEIEYGRQPGVFDATIVNEDLDGATAELLERICVWYPTALQQISLAGQEDGGDLEKKPETKAASPPKSSITALDMDDLDEEDLKALAEVKKQGYYHNRPKSVAPPPPQRIDAPGPELISSTSAPSFVKRNTFDAYQQKWDKFEDDTYVREVEREAKVVESSARKDEPWDSSWQNDSSWQDDSKWQDDSTWTNGGQWSKDPGRQEDESQKLWGQTEESIGAEAAPVNRAEEARRIAEDAEAAIRAADVEVAERKAKEDEDRAAAELEAAKKSEEEARRIAEEAEAERKAAEAEIARMAEDERRAAEAAEKKAKEHEDRNAAQLEAAKKVEEDARRQAEEGNQWSGSNWWESESKWSEDGKWNKDDSNWKGDSWPLFKDAQESGQKEEPKAVPLDLKAVEQCVKYLRQAQDIEKAKRMCLNPKSGMPPAVAQAAIAQFESEAKTHQEEQKKPEEPSWQGDANWETGSKWQDSGRWQGDSAWKSGGSASAESWQSGAAAAAPPRAVAAAPQAAAPQLSAADEAAVAKCMDYLRQAKDAEKAKKLVLNPKSGLSRAVAEAAIERFDRDVMRAGHQ